MRPDQSIAAAIAAALVGCGSAAAIEGRLLIDMRSVLASMEASAAAAPECAAGLIAVYDRQGNAPPAGVGIAFDTCAEARVVVPCQDDHRDGPGAQLVIHFTQARLPKGRAPILWERTTAFRAACRGGLDSSAGAPKRTRIETATTALDGTVSVGVSLTGAVVSLSFATQPSCAPGYGLRQFVAAGPEWRRMVILDGRTSLVDGSTARLDRPSFAANGRLAATPSTVRDPDGQLAVFVGYSLGYSPPSGALSLALEDLLIDGTAVDAALASSGFVHLAAVPSVRWGATFDWTAACAVPAASSLSLLHKLHLDATAPIAIGVSSAVVARGLEVRALEGSFASPGQPLLPGFVSQAARFEEPSLLHLQPCPGVDTLAAFGVDATDGRLRAMLPSLGAGGFTVETSDLLPGTALFAACFP